MARLAQPFYLGPYRVIAELGAGGFATVYRAVVEGEMGFTRDVALKVLHPHLTSNDAEVVKMLADEARLLARMQHPNIVYVQWFGQLQHPGGQQVFAMMMEYVEGNSFRALMAEDPGKLPLSVVTDVHLEVARALAFAHSLRDERQAPLGLVHRDLKPDNVMISHQGVIKLLDFGIAKASDRIAQNTKTDFLRGTVHYMSPEQVAGERNLDFRSDLFSFGAMWWEALLGRRLIASDSVIAALHAVATFDAAEALEEVERLRPEAAPILARLIARDRDDRYHSTDALVGDMEGLRRTYAGSKPTAQWLRERVAAAGAATAQLGKLGSAELGETLDIATHPPPSPPIRGTGGFVPVPSRASSPGFTPGSPYMGTAAHAATVAPPALDPAEEAGSTRLIGRPVPAPGGPDVEEDGPPAPARSRSLGLAGAAAGLGVAALIATLWMGSGGGPAAPTSALDPAAGSTTPSPPPVAPTEGPSPSIPSPAAPAPPEPTPALAAAPNASPAPQGASKVPSPVRVADPTPRPGPPKPEPTPSPTPEPMVAAAPAGPPGRLKVSSAQLFDVAVGPRQFNQLQARTGIELSPGTHKVRVICLDCTGPVTEVSRSVDITSGQTTLLPDVKF